MRASEGATTMLEKYLRSYLEELKWSLGEIDPAALGRIIDVFARARVDGRQILLVGNGGSAATASHMACDLGKGTIDCGDPDATRFRVLSLSDNSALITALGNDVAFEEIFAQQLRIVMRDGDVVVFISASGNSPNLLRALEYARSRGAITIGLLGFGGGRLRALVDHPLVVSSRNYGIAEDFHLIVQHVLTQFLRRVLAGPPRPVVFLDRDGVINSRPAPHQYVETWDQFRFTHGVLPALQTLAKLGYELVVVTNQQGIGNGRVSLEALRVIHEGMRRTFEEGGVRLAGIYYCPHLESDRCFCRKPQPGLILKALNELPFLIEMRRSALIGDSDSDMLAGHAAGLRTILIGAQSGASAVTDHSVSSILEAVALLSAAEPGVV